MWVNMILKLTRLLGACKLVSQARMDSGTGGPAKGGDVQKWLLISRFHCSCAQLKISTNKCCFKPGKSHWVWGKFLAREPRRPTNSSNSCNECNATGGQPQESRQIFFVQELDEVWTVVSSGECASWVEKQIELGKNFSSEW